MTAHKSSNSVGPISERVPRAVNGETLASRGRTAIQRHRCSKPVAVALSQGLITRDRPVFDYGCGKGDDLKFLRSRSIECDGWDPVHRPRGKVKASAIVNLGYVLNVIEDVDERAAVLRQAYELAEIALVVSVRVDNSLDGGESVGDGLVTSRGTFQKIFDQQEFRSYLEDTLGTRAHTAELGIAYVFKEPQAEAEYLASRAFSRRLEYRTDLIAEFSEHEIARRYVAQANQLGRLPLREEFEDYDALHEVFGSDDRVRRLALTQIDRGAFEDSVEGRRDDVLTFLAILQLQRMEFPPLNTLIPAVRGDIRDLWGSYREAQAEARAFLFSIADSERVQQACVFAGVGKLLPDSLYVHAAAEPELPPLIRIIIHAAHTIVGDLPHDLIKISLDGRAVSYLRYDNFDEHAHPALRYSVRVDLPRAKYKIRNFSKSANPPIIHRKECFVTSDYPHREDFVSLSKQEEERGLLSRSDIGHQRQWLDLLAENGLEIQGHSLVEVV